MSRVHSFVAPYADVSVKGVMRKLHSPEPFEKAQAKGATASICLGLEEGSCTVRRRRLRSLYREQKDTVPTER